MYIFKITLNCIYIVKMDLIFISRLQAKSKVEIKTNICYFYINHSVTFSMQMKKQTIAILLDHGTVSLFCLLVFVVSCT